MLFCSSLPASKKQQQENKRCQSWTPSGKTLWIRTCMLNISMYYTPLAFVSCKPSALHCKFSKTCVKRPLSKRPKFVFKVNYRIMQVKRFAEWSILQYFRPSLRYHLSVRPLVCLVWSGRFTQVFLYVF